MSLMRHPSWTTGGAVRRLVWRTALAGVVLGAVIWILTAVSPAHTQVVPVGQRESATTASNFTVRFVSGTRFDAPIASTTLTALGVFSTTPLGVFSTTPLRVVPAGADAQVATSNVIAIAESGTLRTIVRR